MPPVQALPLGKTLGTSLLLGYFWKLLMILFAFPMTSKVPLPQTPPPAIHAQLPCPPLPRETESKEIEVRETPPPSVLPPAPWYVSDVFHNKKRTKDMCPVAPSSVSVYFPKQWG